MTVRSVVCSLVLAVALLPGLAGAADNDVDTQMTPAEAQKVLQETRPRAKKGDASAQYNLGVLYDRGLGVKQDYDEARHWYEKAAKQRYGRAEHNLGILYESGKGVPRNAVKAAYWFRRGADDGQAASQNNLGVLYMKGSGVPQNSGKAAFWTARAAAAGNGAAIENLPRIVEDLPKGHVNAADVNVRDQPDSDARVVRQADSDSVVVILAREPEWTQVLFPKTYETGWIANFLLSNSMAPLNDTPAQAPTKTDTPSADHPDEDSKTPDRKTPPAEDKKPTVAPVNETSPDTTTAPAKSKTESAPASTPESKPALEPEAKPAPKPKPAGKTAANGKNAKIGAGTVNLRAKPNRSATVIGQLHRDDSVAVEDRRNSWARVRTQGGMEGWLADYLLVSP